MLAEGQIFNLYNSNGPRKEGDRLLIILSLQLRGDPSQFRLYAITMGSREADERISVCFAVKDSKGVSHGSACFS
jgi:hypothetical protein